MEEFVKSYLGELFWLQKPDVNKFEKNKDKINV